MVQLVSFHIAILSIGFTIVFAGMWLLSTVDEIMFLEDTSLNKRFATEFTAMWFDPLWFSLCLFKSPV